MTTSGRASRCRVAPVTDWSYQAHFLITIGFALAVVSLLLIGGA